MTNIVDQLLDAKDGWTGDAACVDADIASEGAEIIKRMHAVLIRTRDWHDGESENDDWMNIIAEIKAILRDPVLEQSR
jgi:hypothetical protein